MPQRNTLAAAMAALVVAGTAVPAAAAPEPKATLELVAPIADYKIYVLEKTQALVEDTRSFVNAVNAGDLDKAKELYAPTRMHYEAIEPIAELFSDLDASIDAREDDYEKGAADPQFTGFHRLEHGLWAKDSTKELSAYADRLMADVTDLNQRINELTFPPATVVGGAAALMEEVAASKISGEEDRYSHTDLWDFQGNVNGAQKIFDLVRPLIADRDPQFVQKVEDNLKTVNETLGKYRTEDGFETYDKLSDRDRTKLAAAVNTLAEDLSTLRGKLGLG